MEAAPKRIRLSASSISPEPGSEGTPKSFGGVSLPSVVLECIFKFYDSLDSLKTWRLVSKPWNDVCCRVLRKVSAVRLYVEEGDGGDLQKFNNFIMDRDTHFPLDWPNPFRNLKIQEASLITAPLVRFVRSSNYKITSLEMVHQEGFDHVAFEGILEQHKEKLIQLSIRGYSDFVPFLTLTEKLGGGGWRSLKSLTLTDTCRAPSEPCRHVEFVIALTRNARLEQIKLDGDLRNVARIFGNNCHSWEKLLRLELESETPPLNSTAEQIHDFMKWTEEIHFGPLTHLSMWFNVDNEPDITSEAYTPYLLPLIQKSSQTVRELRVDFVSLKLFPSLPNLTHLSCAMMNGDQIHDITDLKFPSLASVFFDILWTEVPTYIIPKDYASNKNIMQVETFWRDPVPSGVTQEILWSMVGYHFPNLKKLIIQPEISSATLHVIKRSLPQLQDMKLTCIDASELLGTSFGEVFTAKGWPSQFFESSALMEMTELTDLTLGKSVSVSRSLISACLGRLPRITFLSFYWNNSLQISDVVQHLGHIQNLEIVCWRREQVGELEKLTESMASLKLVKDEG